MPDLVLFGDSWCAESHLTEDKNAWWHQVAAERNLGIKNYAVLGAGLYYSIVKYFEYLNNDYSVDDVIVFIAGGSRRSPIVHESFPPGYSVVMSLFHKNYFTLPHNMPEDVIQHFNEHKQFYATWMHFYNPNLHLAHVNLIREALNGLPNKKIILNGNDEITETTYSRKYDFHPNGDLHEVSMREYKTFQDYATSRKSPETRAAHLSPVNHDVLARFVSDHLRGIHKNLSDAGFERGFLSA